MSIEEVKRFSQAVQASPELQEEIKKIGPDLPALAAFAAQKGYTFSVDDVQQCAAQAKGQLTEEQLDSVAGGDMVWTHTDVVLTQTVVAVHYVVAA